MLCEQCGQNPATVHMTKIINNQKMEAHLCAGCAKSFSDVHSGIDFPNILATMFEQPTMWGAVTRTTACPTCHLKLGDIRRLSQLGCSDCYSTFRQELGAILRRVHGTTKHVGKVPTTGYARVKRKRQLESLKDQLRSAVSTERYERAAEIRDEIRRLEQETQHG